jgi:diguanylate cyclase (GGDEF)-like protein
LAPNEQEKDLFVKIFRQLSAYKDPYQSISGILKDTCDFFGFYCGFVYEADHAQVFRLCEHYLCGGVKLADHFSLREYLDGSEIESLVKQTGEIVYLNSRKNQMGTKFLELFSAQTLIMVPVIFDGKIPMAFVGMMDRRHPIRLSKREIDDADAVLSVLAGHIKTRVYQRRLEYAHESLKNIVNNVGLDIYVSDFYSYELLFVNEFMAAPYGGADNILGKLCWKVFSPGQEGPCDYCPRHKLIDLNRKPLSVYSWDFQRPLDGSWFRILNTAFKWVDGRLVHVVSSINITENKKNEDLIRRLAEKDALTSLPNRRKFIEDLDAALKGMKQAGTFGYLLFLDLDDFKKINDTLGHLEGDNLLCQISAFLMAEKESLGSPYRYGGDEFVIISENKTGEDLERITSLLLKQFGGNWELKTQAVRCEASIGAVRFPEGDKSAQELIQKADAAMYEVKKSGKHGFLLHRESY